MSNANCFIAGVNYEDPELKNAPPLPNPDAEELARKEADKRRFRLDVVRARLQRIFESKRKDEFCCSLENTWLKLEEMMAGPALAELYDAEPEKFAKLESAIEANEMNLVDCPTDDQVQNLRKKVSEAQRKGVLKKLYAGDQVQADSLAHQPFVFWKNMGRETFHEWVTRISQILKQNNGPPKLAASTASESSTSATLDKPKRRKESMMNDPPAPSNENLLKQNEELRKQLAEARKNQKEPENIPPVNPPAPSLEQQVADLRQQLAAAAKAKAEPEISPPPAITPASTLTTAKEVNAVEAKFRERLDAVSKKLNRVDNWHKGALGAAIFAIVLASIAIFIGLRADGNGGAAANKSGANQTQSDDSEVRVPDPLNLDLSELD